EPAACQEIESVMSKRPARTGAALAAVIAAGQQSTRRGTSERLPGRRPRIMYIERKAGSLTGVYRAKGRLPDRTGAHWARDLQPHRPDDILSRSNISPHCRRRVQVQLLRGGDWRGLLDIWMQTTKR